MGLCREVVNEKLALADVGPGEAGANMDDALVLPCGAVIHTIKGFYSDLWWHFAGISSMTSPLSLMEALQRNATRRTMRLCWLAVLSSHHQGIVAYCLPMVAIV